MKTKEGNLHYPYGIGQSLVMLPADVIADPIANAMSPSKATRTKIRNGLVGILTFPPICAATIVLAFGFLGRLGFGRRESAAGALALLFGTSLLLYTQVHQENSLLFLLLLAALDSALTWARTGGRRSLAVASCALGASLLVRVTSVLDAAAVAAITACVLAQGARSTGDGAALRRRITDACLIGAPCFLAFAAVERFYQWWRFGDLTSTYVHVWAAQKKALFADWPPGFPFANPFWEGFAGQTIGLYKSVFLFDPLLILTISMVGIRIPFATLLMPRYGADAIWWSFPVGTIASAVMTSLYYKYGGWRRSRMLRDEAHAQTSDTGLNAPAMTPSRAA